TLIRKNLFRKRLRAILLIVSILVAFLIFGMLGAMQNAFSMGTTAAAQERLVTVNRINFTVAMPYAYWDRINQVEGVRVVAPASWFGGYYQEPQNFVQSFAVDPQSYIDAYPELVFAEAEREAFIQTRTCAAIGQALVTQYGWAVGDRIPLMSNIWQQQGGGQAWEMDICAIFDDADGTYPTNYLMFHYEYFNESLAFGRDSFHWMTVVTDDASRNDEISQAIDALFANSPAETSTTTEAAFNEAFMEQFGNIGLILTWVIAAAFATILMIVGTTMVMAVNERTREIAVLKTLGFTEPRIFRMILWEALLLSFAGGLIGLGLAALASSAASAAMSGFLPPFGLSLVNVATAIAFMAALGFITGLLPAWNAMRVRISDALGKI
ncbi:MAG: FtsX-like permease family protein, partial [Oceanicaulis sp.]|nr:FtsX-like permease family protein [Oceanicaulis sp.]